MSFAKITELNDHFISRFNCGIEEIKVCDFVFRQLTNDVDSLRMYDDQYKSRNYEQEATTIVFHGSKNKIVIKNSFSDIVSMKKEQIAQLESDIEFIKRLQNE